MVGSSSVGGRLPALSDDAARELIEALGAGRGLVAAVGAGGKKTTLQRLAEAHLRLRTGRLAITATVQMALPADELGLEPVIAPAEDIEAALRAASPRANLVLAAPPSKPGRLAGLPPAVITRLYAQGGFRVMLVKADGARMRGIKAPGPGEPVLPEGTSTVLPIVSLGVIGRPLDPAVAHRPERLAAVLDLEPGQLLTAAHLARWLASPAGALQGTGAARVIPILNAVERPDRLVLAHEVAARALHASDRFERVVLASMIGPRPVVGVVMRDQDCQ